MPLVINLICDEGRECGPTVQPVAFDRPDETMQDLVDAATSRGWVRDGDRWTCPLCVAEELGGKNS